MKYLILVPDGMADRPVPSLGNRTPMEAARKPRMDALAQKSLCGTVSNVPEGMVPESDTANLSILSYDPKIYSKGRSPLEAMSMGLTMSERDTALRCNVVTLDGTAEDPYESRVILDHSSGDITTEEARELVNALNEALPREVNGTRRTLYTGVSYRHCLLWEDADEHYAFMRPHDILGKVIGPYLPKEDNGGAEFLAYMREGAKVLDRHPVNEARRARGLRPANSPWLWSPGKKPALPRFSAKWGLTPAVISAVDLIKGIGVCAGCDVISVEGATGNFETNYRGKAEAAIRAFRDHDFVYIHVEAPDECGHQGRPDLKTASVEKIDAEILGPVYGYLRECGEAFRILVLPDHPTPIETRTHSIEPVPFFIYDSSRDEDGVDVYTEASCAAKPLYIPDGSLLLSHFIL
jgi:2,3-bisphosphoglycerate-independent phosphoglycerate mutase